MLSEEELKKEILKPIQSQDYVTFKKETLPTHFTLYEKACNKAGSILGVKVDKKKEQLLWDAIKTSHLQATPKGVIALSLLLPICLLIIGILVSFLLSMLFLRGDGLLFFIVVSSIFSIGMMIPLTNVPILMANNWRLRASNQMVLSIFYLVSYMRHTSNLELAIKFTSDHLAPPLSLDFKKILWNVQTSKFSSIKESMEDYLDGWKKYNMEFVESMHLIESSLYEATDKKRIAALEKAMQLILETTYEKMLHFAQELKSPITMLHMLGVILPILGLVILPLVVSFMGNVEWYHIAVIYNLFLPAIVFYLGKSILSNRPTGYGKADITKLNPDLVKYTKYELKLGKKTLYVDPKKLGFFIAIFCFFIALLPIIIYGISSLSGNYVDIAYIDDSIQVVHSFDAVKNAKVALLEYKAGESGIEGPYGLGATLLSVIFPLGLALGAGFYFSNNTKKLITIREKTNELEQEFASALFQLGNRISDGIPAEIAFSKVAAVAGNTHAAQFFDLVAQNISALGMGVEEAIFSTKYGALKKYPSGLIESSMKVFIESAKKGPQVAAKALINISSYIKELHRVDERLKDLMAEITTSMQSQINFLAPLISGIVIGLTSMITSILNRLGTQLSDLNSSGIGNAGQTQGLLTMFSGSIPTYYFQIVVGVYIVQITYLLTIMLNVIQNGYDPLAEKYLLGKYLKKSGLLYSVIALTVMILFNLIASFVITQP